MSNKFYIKDAFVCNHCRTVCKGTCSKELEEIEKGIRENDDLFPRKQLIGCLGKYCDKPCHLRKNDSDLTIEHLLRLTKYLGDKLNETLSTNKNETV